MTNFMHESVDKFWMVVDVSETREYLNDEYIPREKAPRFLHTSEGSAERECLRLASKYPGGRFVILEAMSFARKVQTTWSGLTKRDPVESVRLEDIPADDGIPF